MATQLGPKAFTIDRLLAIFYAILDEKVGLTCNLLAQISTLIHLKFLNFASGEGTAMDGSARLQCTVRMTFIVHIGKMVGFNVRQYLCDFF
ncbi:origin recognition complex subunit [Culex quinquefasciatus]|nr:origin recognition complex subunit [Culex quinquefasciatus]|eukprot:XP_001846030.1 origin recognition complex subunit [Culex quinquefasciatus]